MVLTLDLETTTFNKGNPYDTRNFIVSHHTKRGDGQTVCSYYTDADFLTSLRESVEGASLIITHSGKFDLSWCLHHGIRPGRHCRIWDTQLAEFILSGQTNSFASLNDLTEKYNLGVKEDAVAEYWAKGISTESIPRDVVESYGNRDVDLTHSVYLAQLQDHRMDDGLSRLIRLCGLDLLVLRDMEFNGFKYDVEGSQRRSDQLTEELIGIEKELDSYSVTKINWDSGDQLSAFLYGGSFTEDVYLPVERIYKSGPKKGEAYIRNEYQRTNQYNFVGHFSPLRGTALKKSTAERTFYSTAEDTLIQLKAKTKESRRIIELLLRRATITKLIGTYLSAMPALIEEMHWEGNYIHGQFNQVVARTGRLSSSRPNMQNAPEEVDEFFVTRYPVRHPAISGS